jgi:hypothetical protein
MLVVMALGGNALLRRGEPLEVDVQRRNLLSAVTRAIPAAIACPKCNIGSPSRKSVGRGMTSFQVALRAGQVGAQSQIAMSRPCSSRSSLSALGRRLAVPR